MAWIRRASNEEEDLMRFRLTLLVALTSAIVAAGVCTTTAAAVPNRTFNAGIGECFLPHNVYGGSGPTITAPSVRYTNLKRRQVRVRAFAIIVNAQTEQWIRWQRFSTRTLRRRQAATFPEWTLDLPSPTTSAFWPAAIRVRLEVFYKGSLVEVWTGKPSKYKTYTNGAYFPTYTGTAAWC
jgi:hypothetical protein